MSDAVTKPGGSAEAGASTEKSTEQLHQASKVNDEPEDDAEGEDDDDDGEEVAEDGAVTASAPKKKKKSKSKKKKKKPAAEPTESSAATEPSQSTKPIATQDLTALLQQLGLSEAGKKEGKAPEDYKFWNTQPVPKFKEPALLQTTDGKDGSLPEGPIIPNKVCEASAKDHPEQLLDGFEWCLIDLEDKDELKEFYELLYNHYVEDTEGAFRFNYSPEFLAWSLKSPGWTKDWHIGIRTKMSDEGKKGKLVASITGIPVTLRVRDQTVKASEINFLAIHRKLRNKRLAPVLIKEVTRRCYKKGICQALYTAGTLLPTPVSTCRYFHRSLDWEHLLKTGFSHVPAGSTPLRQKIKYKLETHTTTKGLRPMSPPDIPAVRDLLTRYSDRFQLRPEFTEEEIAHWLCSDTSKGVVYSYVAEQDGKITDFISYYLLDSTVLKSSKKEVIRAAYLYYYATETAFLPKSKANEAALQARLQLLVHDALILAKKDNVHVFNALTLLDNPLFLTEEKFAPGDGKLHYYLFNWRTSALKGGIDERNQIDTSKMGGIGVVML